MKLNLKITRTSRMMGSRLQIALSCSMLQRCRKDFDGAKPKMLQVHLFFICMHFLQFHSFWAATVGIAFHDKVHFSPCIGIRNKGYLSTTALPFSYSFDVMCGSAIGRVERVHLASILSFKFPTRSWNYVGLSPCKRMTFFCYCWSFTLALTE